MTVRPVSMMTTVESRKVAIEQVDEEDEEDNRRAITLMRDFACPLRIGARKHLSSNPTKGKT